MAHGAGGALKEFFISLGLDADQASWASAKLSVDGLEEGLEKLVEMAKEVAEVLAESVIGTAEFADHIGDVSQQTGLSTRSLQQFGLQAAIAGSSSEEFVAGMMHLAKSMGEARDGSKTAQEAFAKLGVRVTDGHGKLRDQEEVLNDVADAIQKLPPGAERTAAAMAVFSRSGKAMVGVLRNGSEGLKKLNEESDGFGLIMSEQDIKSAGDFADQMELLKEVGKSLQHDFAMPIIEALGPVIEALKEWISENRELIRTKLQDFARGLIAAFTGLWNAGRKVLAFLEPMVEVGKFLVKWWKQVAVVIAGVAGALLFTFLPSVAAVTVALEGAVTSAVLFMEANIAAAASSAVAWAAAAIPIIGLAALIAVLVLAVEDVMTYLRGGDSVIGDLGEKWTRFIHKFTERVPGENWLTSILKEALRAVTDIEDTVIRIGRALGVNVSHESFAGEHGVHKMALAEVNKLPDSAAKDTIRSILENNNSMGLGYRSGTTTTREPLPGPLSARGQEPSPSMAAKNWINAPQTNYVTVHAAPGQSAAEVGSAVKDAIHQHWEEQMRATAAAKQGG